MVIARYSMGLRASTANLVAPSVAPAEQPANLDAEAQAHADRHLRAQPAAGARRQARRVLGHEGAWLRCARHRPRGKVLRAVRALPAYRAYRPAAPWATPAGWAWPPPARLAREWLDLIEQGRDPKAGARSARWRQQRRQQTTFTAVAEDWLRGRRAAAKQRKGHEVQRDVRRELISALGQAADHFDHRRSTFELSQVEGAARQRRRATCWATPSGCSTGPSRSTPTASPSPAERLRPKDIVGKKVMRQRVLRTPS